MLAKPVPGGDHLGIEPQLPPPIEPMLASAGEPPTGDGWVFEPKWDGMRLVVRIAGQRRAATTRSGRDVTAGFPELDSAAAGWLTPVTLDVEVVALDGDGRASFQRLQERMHRSRPTPELVHRVPVTIVAFDLLHLGDHDLTSLPQAARRSALVDLAPPGVVICPSFDGDGEAVLEAAAAQGFEGIVAKRTDQPYEPGRRVKHWVKTKALTEREWVVGGWYWGEGKRAGGVGSLIVGGYDSDGRLRLAGSVGTGMDEAERARLGALLAGLETDESPFADPVPKSAQATFVRPEVVIQVAFTERTAEGRLRQPVYKGQRADKLASEVGWDSPA